jgi:hypothetical protein
MSDESAAGDFHPIKKKNLALRQISRDKRLIRLPPAG